MLSNRWSWRSWRFWSTGLLAWLALSACAHAGPIALDLQVEAAPVPLGDWGDYWIDPSGSATPDELATDRSRPWTRAAGIESQAVAPGQALWLRFAVPPAPDWERWYLELRSPRVTHAALYTREHDGRWTSQQAGTRTPVASWPVPHRHPLLPLNISAEEPRYYLLRLETGGGKLDAPVQFVSESHLARRSQASSLMLGVYLGLCGLSALLALACARWWREGTPALAAGVVLLVGLYQLGATGLAGLHLWPGVGGLTSAVIGFMPVLCAGALTVLLLQLGSLRDRSPGAHNALLVLCGASLLVAAVVAALPGGIGRNLAAGYVVLCLLAGLGATAWVARRGDRLALCSLPATLPLACALALATAQAADLVALSAETAARAVQLASALHWPALLAILVLRNQRHGENTRRLRGLDRMDPATGLINRFEFTERLVRMMARSQRLRYRSFVLVVEIINMEQLRLGFDRQLLEEAPVRVGQRLLEVARDIDTVARLDDHRFGILVEGPLTSEEATSIGPRAVARCLMPFDNKPAGWQPQVRVAQALVPHQDCAANVVIAELETLLAAVPQDSRRFVFTLADR